MIETTDPRPQPVGAGSPAGGLSAQAAVVLVTVVTVVAAVASAATGHQFGRPFNFIYLVVTLYAALRIYVADRFVAVIAPPIVYAFALFVAGFFDTAQDVKGLVRVVENTFVNLTLGAPWLVTATVATIVIAVVRGRRTSVARRR